MEGQTTKQQRKPQILLDDEKLSSMGEFDINCR